MSQVNIESTNAPRSAAQNPATAKPGTMDAMSKKSNAFKMNEKSPNVMIVIGNVRIFKTGLMMSVMTDHTSAAKKRRFPARVGDARHNDRR